MVNTELIYFTKLASGSVAPVTIGTANMVVADADGMLSFAFQPNFTLGLTKAGDGTVTNNLITGVTGGQTIIGSNDTNTGLTIKATSNVGTTDADIILAVGTNGDKEAIRILNSGAVKLTQLDDTTGVSKMLTVTNGIVNYEAIPSGGTSGSGTSGTSGTSGINGTSGVNGTSGINGTSGVNGTSGLTGTSGTSGVSGSASLPTLAQNHLYVGDATSAPVDAGNGLTYSTGYLSLSKTVNVDTMPAYPANNSLVSSSFTIQGGSAPVYNYNYALNNLLYIEGYSGTVTGYSSAATNNQLSMNNVTFNVYGGHEWAAMRNFLGLNNTTVTGSIFNTKISTQLSGTTTISGTLAEVFIAAPIGTPPASYYGIYQESSAAKNYFAGTLKLGSDVLVTPSTKQLSFSGGAYQFTPDVRLSYNDGVDATILIGNLGSATAAPAIVGKNSGYSGLNFLGLTVNSNNIGDVRFSIRTTSALDFTTLTNDAYVFNRYTTDLFKIRRDGILILPQTPATYSSGSYDVLVRNQTSGNIEKIPQGTFSYVAKTANYTATADDYTIDYTSGTATITLPTAVGITGKIYNIKNSGAGTITIATTSSQTIDGASTKTLSTQYSVFTLQSNGTNWIIL